MIKKNPTTHTAFIAKMPEEIDKEINTINRL
jgi:hypothetical protein